MSTGEPSSIEQFGQYYADRTYLVDQLEQAPPSLKELLQHGIEAADAQASELAGRDEALRAHYLAIGHGPVADMAKLEEVTPIFERLGMTAELAELRAKVAAEQANPDLPVANYYLGLVGEAPSPTTQPVTPAESPEALTAAPASSETGETAKPKLTILVDPNNNISINGHRRSLSRELQLSRPERSEADGRALRADILIFLANNPGKMFKAGEIWEGARPGVEFDRETWNLYGKSFFLKGLSFNRKSIIVADTSVQKVYRYGITTDYDVTIERTNHRLKVNDNVYTLPNGKEVAGRVGQVLGLLDRATAKKPLSIDTLLESLPAKERTGASKDILSREVGQARIKLRTSGVDLVVQPVWLDEKDPQTGRRRRGYYLRKMTKEEREQAQASEPEAETESPAESHETEESEEALSLHEATILAGFLHFYSGILKEQGLEPVPYDIFEALNQKVVHTYTNGEKSVPELDDLREQTRQKIFALLSDTERLNICAEQIEQDDKDDPRIDLLLYLLDFHVLEHGPLLKELLAVQPGVALTFDPHRQDHPGYTVVETRTQPSSDTQTALRNWYDAEDREQ